MLLYEHHPGTLGTTLYTRGSGLGVNAGGQYFEITAGAFVRYGGYYKSCMTLNTRYLGNNGTIVYEGHAGLLVSTVPIPKP